MDLEGKWRTERAPNLELIAEPTERIAVMRALCRDAERLLAALSPEQRARTIQHRDPVPDSTREALGRMREAYARSRSRG